MPKVFNKRYGKIPPSAVYIGRPSKWGNPYKIGGNVTLEEPFTNKVTIIETKLTRERVLALYREYITEAINDKALNIEELRGKDLVCWCSPEPCHGDILLELANK